MAKTKVDIEVELTGLQKVEKAIKGVEGGLDGVGESGAQLAQAMGATNEKLGEGLENLAGSVGQTREAFTELGGSLKNLGTSGMSGILSLIGPLGMLVSAGVLVYETFRQITGAAQEAEEAQEAMAAAASDLQSRFEALAEKGVIMAAEEVDKFSMAVLESQFRKERAQKAQEKYAKAFEYIRINLNRVRKATEELKTTEEIFGKENERTIKKVKALEEAQRNLQYSRDSAKLTVHKLNEELRDYLTIIEKIAEEEEKIDKRTTESLKKDALRLASLLKENDTIELQNRFKKDQIQLNEMLAEVQARNIKIVKDLEDANRAQVKQILAGLEREAEAVEGVIVEYEKGKKRAVKELLEITINEKKQAQERTKIRREESKKRLEDAKRAQADQLRLREQEKKKDLVLTSQIRQAEIKLLFEKNEQALELENERHRVTLELTKQGSKERELEEKRHQLALRSIKEGRLNEEKRQENERLQLLQQANERELNLRYDLARRMTELEQQPAGFGTEFEKLAFESKQRSNLLELEFQREINLARMRGEEITSIQKKYALERQAITQETSSAEIEILQAYFDQYAAGFAAAGYNALFFGESFKAATSQILRGLGEQAAVQALMETAKAFSALFYKDAQAFATSMKSAGLYTAAALAAGVASNALGGGGGGGVAAPAASPTGQPTTAPTPEREEATTSGMVFNINFGGAVVYDTKKAAEQALADRLVSIINTPRRGAVQFNRR